MQRPTGEIEGAHFGRAHAVEEKLEIPDNAGCGAQGEDAGRLRGRCRAVATKGFIAAIQIQAPECVGEESARQDYAEHHVVLKQRVGAGFDREFGNRHATLYAKGETGTHQSADKGHHQSFDRGELVVAGLVVGA